MKYVYRGVHAGHPTLDEAKRGNVVPGNIDGATTPDMHNLSEGLADSPFTSWTHRHEVALGYARRSGPGGVVLQLPIGKPKRTDSWSWAWSPDVFGEAEVLLRGLRSGATVEVI
jgi:hypothetical protein